LNNIGGGLIFTADCGKYGTLSEIAIALKLKKPVFGLKTWDIEGVVKCATPEDAVLMAVRAARLKSASEK